MLEIPIVNDSKLEGNEIIRIYAVPDSPAYGYPRCTTDVVILDDDRKFCVLLYVCVYMKIIRNKSCKGKLHNGIGKLFLYSS